MTAGRRTTLNRDNVGRRLKTKDVRVGEQPSGLNDDSDSVSGANSREEEEDAIPPYCSDEALALQFAEEHEHDLRYVAAWGRWMEWTGSHWQFDDTLRAFDLARKMCRKIAAGLNKPKRLAITITSAKTVAAVERLARSDRRLAARTDQWDADPWCLNTPGGVVDLKTGSLRPHNPSDYHTKMTAVSPGGTCERFLDFLEQITGGDRELQLYLRRVVGYSLTGCTDEHALFFGYGTGANGKSALLNAVSGLLDSYHRTAPIETFIASSGERHPTDIAGLHGARLVTATETEKGRRWAEAKIKSLTGGDKVSARFMRGDFFDFIPIFKLFITGNHKPSLRSVDEAIRRRFHLIPFAVTIPADERDQDLGHKLQAEWGGILQWAIEGCVEWRTGGLCPPQAVLDATEAYMQSEDAFATWVDEKCVREASAWQSVTALFTSWKDWAEASREHPGTRKEFRNQLEQRGLVNHRRAAGDGYLGLKLIQEKSAWTPPG